jgi:hypothetical protein
MMKKTKILTIIILIFTAILACQKEISEPEISEIYFSMKDSDGRDSVITEGVAGELLKITVKTDANICVVWPSGIRDTLKSAVNPDADSVDNRGIVMRRCDNYNVYQQQQLTGIYGHLMQQLLDMSGFSLDYIDEETEDPGYLNPETYTVTVVATKDGYDGGYKRTIINKTIIIK